MIEGINILALIAAIISSWLLGGIWYAKPVFGKIYCDSAGMKKGKPSKHHTAAVFTLAFSFWALAALAFELALGLNPPLWYAIYMGLLVGICFVGTSLGVNYAFAGKSIKIFLIDAGYHIMQFLLYGLIFGLWH
jgi:hypothetical protein